MQLSYEEPDPKRLIIKFRYINYKTGYHKNKKVVINQVLSNEKGKRYVPHQKIKEYIDVLISSGSINDKFLENTNSTTIKSMIMKSLRSKYSATQISNHVIKKMNKIEEPSYKDSKYPKRLFDPNGDMSSFSMAILGSSGSGKTTLMSNELNKMNPGEYDLIVLFTESKNAAPLQYINPDLKVMVIEGFDDYKLFKLKKINDKTNNLFRFLVILDDIIDQKHSSDLNKSLMVYRNSNISTVICCQYPQILNKMARGSVHYVVITGFRSLEDWENVSRIYDLTEWGREQMTKNDINVGKKVTIYKWLKENLNDPLKIIFINQKFGKEPIIHNF